MRFSIFLLLIIALLSLQTGCKGRSSNRVIEGSEVEITPEMVLTEEAELETTE